MRLIDADDIHYCEYDLDNYHSFSAVTDDEIAEMPTIDAAPIVHGRWLSYFDGDFIEPEMYFQCNKCGSRGHRIKWHYCPNCGAKMDLKN